MKQFPKKKKNIESFMNQESKSIMKKGFISVIAGATVFYGITDTVVAGHTNTGGHANGYANAGHVSGYASATCPSGLVNGHYNNLIATLRNPVNGMQRGDHQNHANHSSHGSHGSHGQW